MGIKFEIPELNLDKEDLMILLAVKLFEEGIVSLGKAAEIAGYSERAFSEVLRHKGISPIKYEDINIKEDSSNA
jgi:predicted HTH domain antitoxin